jgi:hypothetical protein
MGGKSDYEVMKENNMKAVPIAQTQTALFGGVETSQFSKGKESVALYVAPDKTLPDEKLQALLNALNAKMTIPACAESLVFIFPEAVEKQPQASANAF